MNNLANKTSKPLGEINGWFARLWKVNQVGNLLNSIALVIITAVMIPWVKHVEEDNRADALARIENLAWRKAHVDMAEEYKTRIRLCELEIQKLQLSVTILQQTLK